MSEPITSKKQSLYFPVSMLQEIRREAARLDRSLSWVLQRSFKIARGQIAAMPTPPVTGSDQASKNA